MAASFAGGWGAAARWAPRPRSTSVMSAGRDPSASGCIRQGRARGSPSGRSVPRDVRETCAIVQPRPLLDLLRHERAEARIVERFVPDQEVARRAEQDAAAAALVADQHL